MLNRVMLLWGDFTLHLLNLPSGSVAMTAATSTGDPVTWIVAPSTFPILTFPCLVLSGRWGFGKIWKYRPSGSPPRIQIAQACGEASQHGRKRLVAMEASGTASLPQAVDLCPQRPEQTHRQQRFAGRAEERDQHGNRERRWGGWWRRRRRRGSGLHNSPTRRPPSAPLTSQ